MRSSGRGRDGWLRGRLSPRRDSDEICERLRTEQDAYAELEAAFPWVRHLPAEDVRQFIADIASWRATAEVYADPELLAKLTAPLDGTDYGPVPEPPAR